MDASKSCWEELSASINNRRATAPNEASVKNRMLTALTSLAKGRHCSRNVQGWLRSQRAEGGAVEIVLSPGDAEDNWRRSAIRLKNLQHLQDGAVLSLKITLSERAQKGIRAYTVGLQGKVRSSSRPWYARIDLTEEPEGKGLCGHPLLHCHVGSDPDEAAQPEPSGAAMEFQHKEPGSRPRQRSRFSPRVPLPWLFPWEALEWLLATADPTLEPRSALPAATERHA